ncbi:hypothetical protein M378DRAFT_165774 [Amanita muscaria Koide BX008]|uniref:Uncharacterized protein n=1 Tax=Amanita muscaria (strain Koide BX008) TaxID=946122 RepID=A0A0C2X141_AMAMK|nr:hypothetical protein M378DRAFT_165774 [Amanita muscaria Koide BX008]
MRLLTLFSSVIVLASVSAAIPIERENNMLMARFAEPDFLADVEVRAYGEGSKLYARGGAMSKSSQGHNKGSKLPSYRKAMKEPPAYQRIPSDPAHLIPYQTDKTIQPPSYRNAWKDPVMITQLNRGRPPRPYRSTADLFGGLSRGASHPPLVRRSQFGHEGAQNWA